MAATPSLGDWFDRLGAAGLRAGVRERLLANALLLRLAVQGRLPVDRVERLRLIGPLVCGSPQQQRDYARLVDEVARAGAGGTAVEAVGGQGAGEAGDTRRARVVWIWLTALVLALLFAVGWQTFGGRFFGGDRATAQAPAASQPASAASGLIVDTDLLPPDLGASAVPQPVYVPQRPLQWALPTLPAWAAPLRWSLAALGGLALVFLVWRLWRHWQRRRPYLEAAYTDRDPVEERLLRDAEQEVAPVGPGSGVLMPVTRALRQRMDGGRAVLDVRATIAATIRQRGRALRPVMRAAQETPEYLALVERPSSDDHQARYHEAVVQALQARGVVVELFFYAHSPQYGVWRLGRAAEAGGVRPVQDRVSFANLHVRFARHRLLVFGDARSALDPDTGEVQPWALAARHHFAQRAWFTPLPVANWARAEAWVAEAAGLDFLLLPMEDAALTTLADWLGSGRARLVQHPQAPFRFPPLIKGQELDWAVRRVAPPDDVLAQLLHELRGYLGPKRMQWLAACAVFPALAWPLTLALGRKLIEDDGERAVGLAALGALPWFRQGRMPGWLRAALLAEMDEARLADLRTQVLARLDKAVAPTAADEGGEVLARISRTHASVRHWLTGRRGQARDLLLVRFLEPALAPKLVQRLPEVFRRGLFRHGSALLGLRGWVEVAAVVPLLAGVLALPGVWSRVEPGMALNAVAAQQWPVGAETGAIKALGVSADGWLVCTRSADDSVRRWRAATGEAVTGDGWCAETSEAIRAKRADGQPIAAISTDGERILTADAAGRLEVWASLSGDLVAAVNAPTLAGGDIQARFAADGSALFAAGKDGQVHRWGAAPPQAVAVLGCATTDAVPRVDAAARMLADRLANPKAVEELPALAPLAYTPAMWQTLGHGTVQQGSVQGVPTQREILVPTNQPEALAAAQTLAAWLSLQTPTQTAWTVRASEAALSMPTLSACEATPVVPEPQLDPVAWPQAAADAARNSQLQTALNAMFATNRASRVQATQKVIGDTYLVSDLLPMALQRAQARGSFDETLTLAQAAMPVTLQRHAAEIYRLLESLPAETDVGAFRKKLLAAKGQRPRVFLQIAEESQRAEAVKIQVQLRKVGFDVPGIEKIASEKVPDKAELRVWGRSDQGLARWLAKNAIGKSAYWDPVIVASNQERDVIAVDTYEMRISPTLTDVAMQNAIPIDGKSSVPVGLVENVGSKLTIRDYEPTGPQPSVFDENGEPRALYKQSHALLISVSDYLGLGRKGWPPLKETGREMDRVAEALRPHGFRVRRVSDPNGVELQTAIQRFLAEYGRDENYRLLVFFSGHGHTDRDTDMSYLVPTDALDPNLNPQGFLAKALPIESLETSARSIRARHAVFLFDSCLSDSIFMSKALSTRPEPRGASVSEWFRFLTEKAALPVRQFIAACGPDELLPAQSQFVPLFIQAMSGSGSRVGNRYVTGKELGVWLEQMLPGFNRHQNPHSNVIKVPQLSFGDVVFQVPAANASHSSAK